MDSPTLNGRVYPKSIVTPALARYWAVRQFDRGENWVQGPSGDPNDGAPAGIPFARGEVEHPPYNNRRRYCSVSPHLVSHEVVGMRWEGRACHVMVEVLLDKPRGQWVLQRLKRGGLIGISVRTWASREPPPPPAPRPPPPRPAALPRPRRPAAPPSGPGPPVPRAQWGSSSPGVTR